MSSANSQEAVAPVTLPSENNSHPGPECPDSSFNPEGQEVQRSPKCPELRSDPRCPESPQSCANPGPKLPDCNTESDWLNSNSDLQCPDIDTTNEKSHCPSSGTPQSQIIFEELLKRKESFTKHGAEIEYCTCNSASKHYHCKMCDFRTTYCTNVVRHEVTIHNIIKPGLHLFRCQACPYVVLQPSEYARHIYKHTKDPNMKDFIADELNKCAQLGVKAKRNCTDPLEPLDQSKFLLLSKRRKSKIAKMLVKKKIKSLHSNILKKKKLPKMPTCTSRRAKQSIEMARKKLKFKKLNTFAEPKSYEVNFAGELKTFPLDPSQLSLKDFKKNNAGPYQCSQCSFKSTGNSFARHLFVKHNMVTSFSSATYQCLPCDLRTTVAYDFFRHCTNDRHKLAVKTCASSTVNSTSASTENENEKDDAGTSKKYLNKIKEEKLSPKKSKKSPTSEQHTKPEKRKKKKKKTSLNEQAASSDQTSVKMEMEPLSEQAEDKLSQNTSAWNCQPCAFITTRELDFQRHCRTIKHISGKTFQESPRKKKYLTSDHPSLKRRLPGQVDGASDNCNIPKKRLKTGRRFPRSSTVTRSMSDSNMDTIESTPVVYMDFPDDPTLGSTSYDNDEQPAGLSDPIHDQNNFQTQEETLQPPEHAEENHHFTSNNISQSEDQNHSTSGVNFSQLAVLESKSVSMEFHNSLVPGIHEKHPGDGDDIKQLSMIPDQSTLTSEAQKDMVVINLCESDEDNNDHHVDEDDCETLIDVVSHETAPIKQSPKSIKTDIAQNSRINTLDFEEDASDSDDCFIDETESTPVKPLVPADAHSSRVLTAGPVPLSLDQVSNAALVQELRDRLKLYSCVCGMSFASKNLYDLHQQWHYPSHPLVCKPCGYVSNSWFIFNKHIVSHHRYNTSSIR